MESSVRQLADVTLIRIDGRVDHATAKAFEEVIKPHLDDTGADPLPKILLDLGGLSFMTSAGLRILMIAAKACAAQGRDLAVAALQPAIAEIFKISRFDLVLKIHPTVEEGLSSLSSEAAVLWEAG
jgi:anti-anti-sigma factor